MNQADLLKLIEVKHNRAMDILQKKGTEYSRDEDALANFKRLGQDLNIPPEKVLWIYLAKHLDAILFFVEHGKEVSTETIEDRIIDASNYLSLLHGIIEEKKNEIR